MQDGEARLRPGVGSAYEEYDGDGDLFYGISKPIDVIPMAAATDSRIGRLDRGPDRARFSSRAVGASVVVNMFLIPESCDWWEKMGEWKNSTRHFDDTDRER